MKRLCVGEVGGKSQKCHAVLLTALVNSSFLASNFVLPQHSCTLSCNSVNEYIVYTICRHVTLHMRIPAIQRYCDFGRWDLRFDLRFWVKDLGFNLSRLGLGLRFEACDLNHSYQRLGFGTWDLI